MQKNQCTLFLDLSQEHEPKWAYRGKRKEQKDKMAVVGDQFSEITFMQIFHGKLSCNALLMNLGGGPFD